MCHENNHTEPFDHIETECSPCGGYYRTGTTPGCLILPRRRISYFAFSGKNEWVKKETHDDVPQLETLDPASPWSNYSEASSLFTHLGIGFKCVLAYSLWRKSVVRLLLVGTIWQPHSGMDHETGRVEAIAIFCIHWHERASPGRRARALAPPTHDRANCASPAHAQFQHAGRSTGWIGSLVHFGVFF